MPMDEYDTAHKIDYDRIINVYANDNISFIIQKVLLDYNLNAIECEYLTENICNTITSLRNGLNILDNRIMTNIGARIFHYHRGDSAPKSYLVQVWRGNRYIKIDDDE
jgi:hypothetical protein